MKLEFKHTILALGIAGLVGAGAAPAMADPIGTLANPCGNGSCDGAVYTLHYSGAPIFTNGVQDIFRVTLDIDLNGYTGGGGFLDNVAIKVAPLVANASLVAAPTGPANWLALNLNTGLNANGCAGGGNGFVCVDHIGNGAALPVSGPGPEFSFTMDVTVATGALFTGVNQASIKARYVDANNQKVGAVMSENITLQAVPEPTTMLLLGSGLLGLGTWNRYRNR